MSQKSQTAGLAPMGSDRSASQAPLTLPYKQVDEQHILVDIYPPTVSLYPDSHGQLLRVPSLVYFHGGGLTVGNRHSWFPAWLQGRLASMGIAFVSADYRLIPPATGGDLLDDIQDLFRFLSSEVNDKPALHDGRPRICIDSGRIAVAGTSAGGLCAYLAAVHASPKPIAVLGMYAMGGNFLTPHYLSLKATPFFRGRELLDPEAFTKFLYPQSLNVNITSDSALSYHPPSAPIPGYPANPRMFLARLYLQLGVLLDYYTGIHEPSLSSTLRGMLDSKPELQPTLKHLLSADSIRLFPQFQVSSAWPPTLLVHGDVDSAVPVMESQYMRDELHAAGVEVSLKVVEGQEHSFDYTADADAIFGSAGGLFDQIASFFQAHLCECESV